MAGPISARFSWEPAKVRTACEQLVRGRWPLLFAPREACDKEVRHAVCAAMRRAAAGADKVSGMFEEAGFHVRLNHEQAGLPKEFEAFSECGDKNARAIA